MVKTTILTTVLVLIVSIIIGIVISVILIAMGFYIQYKINNAPGRKPDRFFNIYIMEMLDKINGIFCSKKRRR